MEKEHTSIDRSADVKHFFDNNHTINEGGKQKKRVDCVLCKLVSGVPKFELETHLIALEKGRHQSLNIQQIPVHCDGILLICIGSAPASLLYSLGNAKYTLVGGSLTGRILEVVRKV
jgi:hypothetical protein